MLAHLGKPKGWFHGEEMCEDCLGREAKRSFLELQNSELGAVNRRVESRLFLGKD